jgi:hypothetical protein
LSYAAACCGATADSGSCCSLCKSLLSIKGLRIDCSYLYLLCQCLWCAGASVQHLDCGIPPAAQLATRNAVGTEILFTMVEWFQGSLGKLETLHCTQDHFLSARKTNWVNIRPTDSIPRVRNRMYLIVILLLLLQPHRHSPGYSSVHVLVTLSCRDSPAIATGVRWQYFVRGFCVLLCVTSVGCEVPFAAFYTGMPPFCFY